MALTLKDFNRLYEETREKLEGLCSKWERKMTEISSELTEELCGNIRSTIGQGRLVMNTKGRLSQFYELMKNCEFNLGEKVTTTSDLEGFWAMIDYQIQDVYRQFSELSQAEKSGWILPVNEPLPPNKGQKRKPLTKLSGENSFVKRSSNLKELIAAKRKDQSNGKTTFLLTPSTPSPTEDSKVFEGGFFNIRSPISSPMSKGSPVLKGDVKALDTDLRKTALTTSARSSIRTIYSPFTLMKVTSTVKNPCRENAKQALAFYDEKEN